MSLGLGTLCWGHALVAARCSVVKKGHFLFGSQRLHETNHLLSLLVTWAAPSRALCALPGEQGFIFAFCSRKVQFVGQPGAKRAQNKPKTPTKL